MVGDTYTQVLSGLSDGQSVVLADYAEAVPSSNTDLTNALGGGGGRLPGRLRRRARHLPQPPHRRRRGRRALRRRLTTPAKQDDATAGW